MQQQIAEITQIAQQTTFNGLNVLNGSSGTTTYQVGASSTYATAVAWQDGTSSYAKAAAINAAGASGLTAKATNSVADAGFLGATSAGGAGTYNLSINGVAIFGGVTAGAGTTASTIAAQINQYSSQDGGVTAALSGGQFSAPAAPTGR